MFIAGVWLIYGLFYGFLSFIALIIVTTLYFVRRKSSKPLIGFKVHATVYGLILLLSIITFSVGIFQAVSHSDALYAYSGLGTDNSQITKDEYNHVKVGISESQLKNTIVIPDKSNIEVSGNTTHWMFHNTDNSSADIFINNITHRVTRKDELGILDVTSDTTIIGKGTIDHALNKEISLIVPDVIGVNVFWGNQNEVAIRHMSVSENPGRKTILLALNAPAPHMNSTAVRKSVNEATIRIASKIKSIKRLKIQKITFLWYLHFNGSERVAYKIDIERHALPAMNPKTLSPADLPGAVSTYQAFYK
jgi:hypothetical protein